MDTYIIGEIGINHNGNLGIAKDLIKVAKECGCNAVKLQKRTVDLVYSKEELATKRESIFGNTNGDLKFGLEFNKEEYIDIKNYCESIDIDLIVSPWDEKSVDFLEDIGISKYKIASATITNFKILNKIKDTNKKVIISTGMSTEEEIDSAVKFFNPKNIEGILVCTSTYPNKYKEINLNRINTLYKKYKLPIGYSGHEIGFIPSIAAVSIGAKIIERHITLSRSMWGSDQHSSLEPSELKEMINSIKIIEKSMGNGILGIYDSEIPIKEKLRK